MQSMLIQSTSDVDDIGPDAAKSIGREMPVELLRASLPHTDERQRKLLLDFAQRSIPVVGFNSNTGGSGGHVNSETVLSWWIYIRSSLVDYGFQVDDHTDVVRTTLDLFKYIWRKILNVESASCRVASMMEASASPLIVYLS